MEEIARAVVTVAAITLWEGAGWAELRVAGGQVGHHLQAVPRLVRALWLERAALRAVHKVEVALDVDLGAVGERALGADKLAVLGLAEHGACLRPPFLAFSRPQLM